MSLEAKTARSFLGSDDDFFSPISAIDDVFNRGRQFVNRAVQRVLHGQSFDLQSLYERLTHSVVRVPEDARNIFLTLAALGRIGIDLSTDTVRGSFRDLLDSDFFDDALGDSVEVASGPRIVVWLVHPTNYQKNGTPRKWKKHILPANAIGQLNALMPEKIQIEEGREAVLEVHFLEDTVQDFDIDAIARSMSGEETKGVVFLVGVQTNQWPRARNLAQLCRERGIPVVAGGYHVRADLPVTEKEARDLGISLAIGEAESCTSDGIPFLDAILQDLWKHDLKPAYRQSENPSIGNSSFSDIIPAYQRLMINPQMATLETSRGCPQPCSFCTIRTIGGTTVRARAPENMTDWLRRIHTEDGIRSLFITDDNFAKSDRRFEVLEIFARLREQGFPFDLMLQVDTTATWGKEGERFLETCKRAGVYSVFLGIESVDPQTLRAMHKPQNRPERYKPMLDAWHRIGVLTQCGFIIGNEHDTVGVGTRSAQALLDMGMDVASAYVLTPLPGSVDYHEFHRRGFVLSSDFNSYDSHSEPCIQFPGGLSPEEVMAEYRAFYKTFYAWENVSRLASRVSGKTLESALRQWLWYRFAVMRGDHPMYSGFRRKSADFRRSDFPKDCYQVSDLAPRPDGPGSPSRERSPVREKPFRTRLAPATI